MGFQFEPSNTSSTLKSAAGVLGKITLGGGTGNGGMLKSGAVPAEVATSGPAAVLTFSFGTTSLVMVALKSETILAHGAE